MQAKSVYMYTVLNSHFSNAASSDEMYRITRATYSPNSGTRARAQQWDSR